MAHPRNHHSLHLEPVHGRPADCRDVGPVERQFPVRGDSGDTEGVEQSRGVRPRPLPFNFYAEHGNVLAHARIGGGRERGGGVRIINRGVPCDNVTIICHSPNQRKVRLITSETDATRRIAVPKEHARGRIITCAGCAILR